MTPFSNVFERFQSKVTDYNLDKLFITNVIGYESYLTILLKSAITNFDNCKQNLTDRDDSSKIFNVTLTEKEEEILATLTLAQWFEKEVNNVLDMRLALSSSDFKRYAESQNLKAKSDARDRVLERSEKLMIDYSLLYFDFGAK